MKARLIVAAAISLLLPNMAQAAEIKLIASAALKAAYLELLPQFEMATGHKVTAVWSSSQVIQKRIAAGEDADLIVLANILGKSLTEELIKQGKLVTSSRAIFAKSGIGVAVRFGAPKPDISSADALKKSILAAKSIAYSAGASGAYLVSMNSCKSPDTPPNHGRLRGFLLPPAMGSGAYAAWSEPRKRNFERLGPIFIGLLS